MIKWLSQDHTWQVNKSKHKQGEELKLNMHLTQVEQAKWSSQDYDIKQQRTTRTTSWTTKTTTQVKQNMAKQKARA